MHSVTFFCTVYCNLHLYLRYCWPPRGRS